MLIIREPFDQIMSYYSNHQTKDEDDYVLRKGFSNYIEFSNFWHNYLKDKKHLKDFLIIDFKDIIKNPNEILKNIVNFYDFKVNEELINISSSIHTKKNTFENLKNTKIQKNRFTNEERKEKFKNIIILKLKTLNKDKLLEENYNKILNLKYI